jgi:hypothetical protein
MYVRKWPSLFDSTLKSEALNEVGGGEITLLRQLPSFPAFIGETSTWLVFTKSSFSLSDHELFNQVILFIYLEEKKLKINIVKHLSTRTEFWMLKVVTPTRNSM